MELYTVQSMRCWYADILYVIGMNIIINKTNPIVSLVQHTIYKYIIIHYRWCTVTLTLTSIFCVSLVSLIAWNRLSLKQIVTRIIFNKWRKIPSDHYFETASFIETEVTETCNLQSLVHSIVHKGLLDQYNTNSLVTLFIIKNTHFI